MKLEKVVSRPKKGFWISVFLVALAVIGVMATSYNVEIAHQMNFEQVHWRKFFWGAVGFIGIVGSLILIFARLLNEMSVSQIQADFLDRISHELRTPISTLTLVSDLLRSHDKTKPELEQKLWRAHDLELARLQTDVELLLQAARLRESRLKVNLETVHVEAWFRNHWSSFQTLLGENAQFQLNVKGDVGTISVDSGLFEMIFRNLLDNARKFSMDQPKVEISVERIPRRMTLGKPRFRISVNDQGWGFNPAERRNLFRRFSRLDHESVTGPGQAIPGTGLGLYLSASASKAMGLTLTGQSLGEGKGARFIIEGAIA